MSGSTRRSLRPQLSRDLAWNLHYLESNHWRNIFIFCCRYTCFVLLPTTLSFHDELPGLFQWLVSLWSILAEPPHKSIHLPSHQLCHTWCTQVPGIQMSQQHELVSHKLNLAEFPGVPLLIQNLIARFQLQKSLSVTKVDVEILSATGYSLSELII